MWHYFPLKWWFPQGMALIVSHHKWNLQIFYSVLEGVELTSMFVNFFVVLFGLKQWPSHLNLIMWWIEQMIFNIIGVTKLYIPLKVFLYGSSLWNYQEIKTKNQTFRTIFIWFYWLLKFSSQWLILVLWLMHHLVHRVVSMEIFNRVVFKFGT